MIVLVVLLWTLGVLLALALVVVLAVVTLPFEAEAAGALAFDDDADDVAAEGRVRARWAWGLVAVRFATGEGVAARVFGARVRPGAKDADDEEARAARAAKKAEKRRKRAARKAARAEKKAARPPRRKRYRRDWWRAKGALGRSLGRLVRAFHLRGEVTGAVGLDDPADTATVVGLLNGLSTQQRLLTVAVEPAWLEETVRLRGRLRTRFHLIAFAWVALVTFLDPRIRRAALGRRLPRPRLETRTTTRPAG